MKKQGSFLLLWITVAFLVITLGVFLARNTLTGDVLVQPLPPAETTAPASDPLIDLNAADLAQLQQLPGVGEVLAQRILAHRQKLGGFTDPAQLLEVEGIGNQKLEALLPYITVGG